MAHILFRTCLRLCFCAFVLCVCVHMSSEVSLMCVIDYIRAAVSISPEQFRDKEAPNSESNLKHQGQVIIKIYDATRS